MPRPASPELGGTGRNDGTIAFDPTLAYAAGTAGSHMLATANVQDYGAIGVANGAAANEATDTAAFAAAAATGRNIYVPAGVYYLSATISLGYGQCMFGAGQYKTNIIYSGAGSGIYMGSSVLTSLIYNCELRDLTLICTNRAATVNGVELQNCVYFNVQNVSVFGSGSPNSAVPADRVLYGSGLYLHDNTIIGRIGHVSCRLWNQGRFYACDAGNQSRWTAAIVDDGQGEVANCMRGIVVGDSTIALYSGVGVSFRDLTFQGCYTTGINVNAGDNTIIESCYFEGNANYDVAVGTPAGAPAPIGVKVVKCTMNAEDIGTTPYGTFPYLYKIYVDRGSFTTIDKNNISISTAISLVRVEAAADETVITYNRLNSAAAVTARISNASTTTITAGNHPEAPTCAAGALTRTLNAATATVAYPGLGFKPTSIEFFGAVDTAVERFIGNASLTGSGYANRCMTTDGAGVQTSSSDCIRLIKAAAGNEQKAVLASFDLDGFTLTWTLVGAPPANTMTVNYIARR